MQKSLPEWGANPIVVIAETGYWRGFYAKYTRFLHKHVGPYASTSKATSCLPQQLPQDLETAELLRSSWGTRLLRGCTRRGSVRTSWSKWRCDWVGAHTVEVWVGTNYSHTSVMALPSPWIPDRGREWRNQGFSYYSYAPGGIPFSRWHLWRGCIVRVSSALFIDFSWRKICSPTNE